MATEQVCIRNSELKTDYYLYVWTDRLSDFVAMAVGNRQANVSAPSMPGLTWAAILGLDAIFAQRPKKFPVEDILKWLQQQINERTNGIVIPIPELEKLLELFSQFHPPDVAAGMEDA